MGRLPGCLVVWVASKLGRDWTPSCHYWQWMAAVAIVPLVLFETVVAAGMASPELTGRWGDVRMPQQLVYEYTSKKTRALVVVAFSTKCPLARRLVPMLNELQRKYDAEGVQFIALFPNGRDDLWLMAKYAVETDVMFPVYEDDGDTPWHEQLGLKTTPSVAVLDVGRGYDVTRVVYRGQIDGMWAGDGGAKRKRDYLASALDSFLKGERPALAETAATGCNITKEAYRDLSEFQDVTYYRDIAPLVQQRCASCHREGEAGAELFAAFDSYDMVASVSDVMLDRIKNRLMPPWHAFTDPQNGLDGFKHDVRLSDRQIKTFQAWVELGCPPGDERDAPKELTWPSPKDWQIGTPDFVFEMPEPYTVPKDRLDEYQFYRVGANFPEDRYIQAIELRPGNKAIVHHIGAIVGPASTEPLSSNQAMLKLYGLTGDQVKKIGDYIAGDPFNARTYPNGYALKLPAGHDIFFEMHYTPTGKTEEQDVSQMAIRWAATKPEHVIDTQVFNRKDIRLRPHDMHYEKVNYYQFESDVLIYALAPHMHYRGKDFTLYKVENPQTDKERRQLVLCAPTYHFGWQRTYEFVKPLRLKAGDALLSVTHFDNSHYNPNNPDPEALVRYGLKSEQEMLNLRVKFEAVNLTMEDAAM